MYSLPLSYVTAYGSCSYCSDPEGVTGSIHYEPFRLILQCWGRLCWRVQNQRFVETSFLPVAWQSSDPAAWLWKGACCGRPHLHVPLTGYYPDLLSPNMAGVGLRNCDRRLSKTLTTSSVLEFFWEMGAQKMSLFSLTKENPILRQSK